MRHCIVVCQVREEGAELINSSLVVKASHTIAIRDALHCEVVELLNFEHRVWGDNCGGTNLPRDVPHQLNGKILRLLIPANRVGLWPAIAKSVGTEKSENREVRHGARLSAGDMPRPPMYPGMGSASPLARTKTRANASRSSRPTPAAYAKCLRAKRRET